MNPYRVIVTPYARAGLREIGEYIALDNPSRAVTFVDEISSTLKKTLSTFPGSGKVAEGIGFDHEIRVLPYGNYNSYYRVNELTRSVEVLFVLNARRDLKTVLESMNS